MTPNRDDPLYRMLTAYYNRARLTSTPIESTYERTVLESLDFDIPCQSNLHPTGVYGHEGSGEFLGTAPCGDVMVLCGGSVDDFNNELDQHPTRPCKCFNSYHTHPMHEYVFTPLPEGNR